MITESDHLGPQQETQVGDHFRIEMTRGRVLPSFARKCRGSCARPLRDRAHDRLSDMKHVRDRPRPSHSVLEPSDASLERNDDAALHAFATARSTRRIEPPEVTG